MALGEECHHLFDLHDLLGGAAKEAKQGFAEGLTQNAQIGKRGDAPGEMGVAAPRQRIGERAGIAVTIEVAQQRSSGIGSECGPVQPGVGVEAEARDVAIPLAEEGAARLGLPTKCLPAVNRLREDRRGQRVGQRERLPRSPTGRRHRADLAQRKLSRLASSSPLPLRRARRHATGWVLRSGQSIPVRPRLKTTSRPMSPTGKV